MVTDLEKNRLHDLVLKLNPCAKIILTSNSVVAPEDVLNTKLFSFAKAALNPGDR